MAAVRSSGVFRMYDSGESWYQDWFNEDYLKLYRYRDEAEAHEQIDFLIENVPLQGNERILDLGCGIGRHAIILADKGFQVLGVDASSTFIQEAQRQYTPERKLVFCLRDMRHLEGLGKFDLVINMFTSFGYFDSDADNRAVLKSVFYALNQKGKFFLDYLNPPYVQSTLVPYEEREIEGEKVVITRNIAGERIIKKIAFPNRSYYENVRLYKREKLEALFESEGFQVLKVWSGYDGAPWDENGARQLFLTRKMG